VKIQQRASALCMLFVAVVAGSCASGSGSGATRSTSSGPRVIAGSDRPIPLILDADEGERRVRRGGGGRVVLKVDPEGARSSELVMTMETIPAGESVPSHFHPSADAIVFVHRGSGTVQVGDRSGRVSEGSTVYIPRSTSTSLRNTGSQPMVIVTTFSQPGIEKYVRETSVPVGRPAAPVSAAELREIRARHTDQIVFENP